MICEEIVSKDCVSYCTTESKWTWFSKATIYKCFTKKGVLKNFAKFTWKHLKPVTPERLKRDSNAGDFLQVLRNFQEFLFYRTPLGDCFWIFFIRFTVFFTTQLTNKNQVFAILNMFYHVFWTWWISWILRLENYTLRNKTKMLSNIYQNSQKNTCTGAGASFLVKLHARGLQLYWKKTYKFSMIF